MHGLRRLGVFLTPFLMAMSEEPDNSGYFFIDRTCVAQNDGHDPIFWGLVKGEFELVDYADKRLNRAYHKALAQRNRSQKQQLRNTQRRWLKATIAKCELDFDGVVREPPAAQCYIHEAEVRTRELLRNWRSK